MQTRAEKNNGEWVLNGTKQFITNATHAQASIIMAMTDPEQGRKGISAFVVDEGTDGFFVSKVEKKMGMRGSPTASLTMEDCKIPAGQILGEPGEGYKQALQTLEGGRLSIGALALGIAQAAFDSALSYANQREAFGKPIGKFQFIQGYLADMSTQISAARLLLYHAAWLKDHGVDVSGLDIESGDGMSLLFVARETGEDVFVHHSAIVGPEPLLEGERVRYELVKAPKGLRARRVTRVD